MLETVLRFQRFTVFTDDINKVYQVTCLLSNLVYFQASTSPPPKFTHLQTSTQALPNSRISTFNHGFLRYGRNCPAAGSVGASQSPDLQSQGRGLLLQSLLDAQRMCAKQRFVLRLTLSTAHPHPKVSPNQLGLPWQPETQNQPI